MPDQPNRPRPRRWKKWMLGGFSLRRVLLSLAEIYLCLLAWAWFFSDRLAFQPPPPTYAEGAGVFRLPAPEGRRLAILALINSAASRVVLFAHGNAEDIGGVRDILEAYRAAGFEVYTFDYRGYGLSDGKPSTANSYADIRTVYNYLVEQKGIHPNRIILHGRSLGAAVALHLATRCSVGGVIVESAFLTAFRARTQIPISPIDKMRNDREIRRLACPVLFIHGEDDRVIPTWQGKQLYRLAPEPRFAYWVPHAGHNDVFAANEAEYWRQIRAFADFLDRNDAPTLHPDHLF